MEQMAKAAEYFFNIALFCNDFKENSFPNLNKVMERNSVPTENHDAFPVPARSQTEALLLSVLSAVKYFCDAT